MLRKDLIIKAAKGLREKDNRIVLSMLTNGYFLTQEVLDELILAGIQNIQISLDGVNSDSCFVLRQNKEAFDKAIEALKMLSKSNITYNIAFCPTKHNVTELDRLVEICKELKINEIRLQPLMIIGRANKNLEQILPTNKQYIELLKDINRLSAENPYMKFQWGDPIQHLYRYRESEDLLQFCSIRANGGITPSPYLPIVVGNIRNHKFSEYCKQGLMNIL